MTKSEIKALIEFYYTLPDHGAGGTLHIVVDDGNCDDASVDFCVGFARKEGDSLGEFIALALMPLSEDERLQVTGWGERNDE